eukprot:736704-Prymnesium_polylepis.1
MRESGARRPERFWGVGRRAHRVRDRGVKRHVVVLSHGRGRVHRDGRGDGIQARRAVRRQRARRR